MFLEKGKTTRYLMLEWIFWCVCRMKKKENDKDEEVKEDERELKDRRCFQCGDMGHVRRDCPEYRHLKQRAAGGPGTHSHTQNLHRMVKTKWSLERWKPIILFLMDSGIRLFLWQIKLLNIQQLCELFECNGNVFVVQLLTWSDPWWAHSPSQFHRQLQTVPEEAGSRLSVWVQCKHTAPVLNLTDYIVTHDIIITMDFPKLKLKIT